jgi:hypothetical protein
MSQHCLIRHQAYPPSTAARLCVMLSLRDTHVKVEPNCLITKSMIIIHQIYSPWTKDCSCIVFQTLNLYAFASSSLEHQQKHSQFKKIHRVHFHTSCRAVQLPERVQSSSLFW